MIPRADFGHIARPGAWLLALLLLVAGLHARPRNVAGPVGWGRVPLEALDASCGDVPDVRIPEWEDPAGWRFLATEAPAPAWRISGRKAWRGSSWRLGRDEGGYGGPALHWLETPAVELTRASRLSFRLRYHTESPSGAPDGYEGWDGGSVWISLDGGPWTALTGMSHRYGSHSLVAYAETFGVADQGPGWSGRLEWKKVTRELGEFAGRQAQLRFVFASDEAGGEDEAICGMQLDDILVQSGSKILLKSDADGPDQPAPFVAGEGVPQGTAEWVPGPGGGLDGWRWDAPPGGRLVVESPAIRLPAVASWLCFQIDAPDSVEGLEVPVGLEISREEGPWESVWSSRVEGGALGARIPLDAWSDQQVRLRWTAAVAGPRLWTRGPLATLRWSAPLLSGGPVGERSLELAQLLVGYPRTEDQPCEILLKVANRGARTVAPGDVDLRLSLDGARPLVVPTARPLASGEIRDAVSAWVPDHAGPHDLFAWLEKANDGRAEDDSLWLGPLDVLPAGQVEFGYSFREAEEYFTGGDPLLFVDEVPRLDLGDFAPTRVTIGFCDPENRADGKTIRLHILEDEDGRPGRERWHADYRLLGLGERFLWEFQIEQELRLDGPFWVWAERRDDYPHVLGARLIWKPGHYALRRWNGESSLDFSRGAGGHELLFWVAGRLLPPREPEAPLPVEVAVLTAQPNPFNPATRIHFTAPAGTQVSLKIYNVAGQEVATLFAGSASGVEQSATFDGGPLASGVYFACLETEDRVATHKLVLSR